MPAFFLDSSAAVKRYVKETGSAWVTGIMVPSEGKTLYAASISPVEVVAALARRQRLQATTTVPASLLQQFRREFPRLFAPVDISPVLIASAMDLAEKHALRGYDAVQLAAVVQVGALCRSAGVPCTFISADAEQNVAAVREGLTVDDPNQHPRAAACNDVHNLGRRSSVRSYGTRGGGLEVALGVRAGGAMALVGKSRLKLLRIGSHARKACSQRTDSSRTAVSRTVWTWVSNCSQYVWNRPGS